MRAIWIFMCPTELFVHMFGKQWQKNTQDNDLISLLVKIAHAKLLKPAAKQILIKHVLLAVAQSRNLPGAPALVDQKV